MNDEKEDLETNIEKASQAPAIVDEVQISELADKVTPVTLMTNGLSAFMNDVFEMSRQEDLYIQQLRQNILADWNTFKPETKAMIVTSETTNRNDLASKVIAPSMQMLTALQQNELAERKERMQQKENAVIHASSIQQVSAAAPAEVLAGLQALFNMSNVMTPQSRNITPTLLKDDEKDERPFGSH